MTDGRKREYTARVASGHAVVVTVETKTLSLNTTANQTVLALEMSEISEVSMTDARVSLVLSDGRSFKLETEQANEIDAAIADACRTVPELTHALRSFGSSRDGANPVRQREFFTPLLDARRRAEQAVARRDAIQAFAANKLERALEIQLASFVSTLEDTRPSVRRAVAAHLEEAVQPLRKELLALEPLASAAELATGAHRIRAWRDFERGLAAVFQAADRVWVHVDRVLRSALPAKRFGKRRKN